MSHQKPLRFVAKQAPEKVDLAIDEVIAHLAHLRDLGQLASAAIRESIDSVIDSERTGRWAQLEKTEKTYIGTWVEIGLRDKLDLPRGKNLNKEVPDAPCLGSLF